MVPDLELIELGDVISHLVCFSFLYPRGLLLLYCPYERFHGKKYSIRRKEIRKITIKYLSTSKEEVTKRCKDTFCF